MCVKCKKGYKVAKSGVVVVEQYMNPPEPYKAIHGDLLECPVCKHQIVAQFSQAYFWEQWHDKPAPEGDHVYEEYE
jgi:hypothetical protein